MRHTIFDALMSLRPNTNWTLSGIDYSDLNWLDEKENCPSKKEIDDEIARLDLLFDNNEYKRDRKKEYPSVDDQLDILYHEGYDGWKKIIKNIKDKYPKSS